MGKHIIDVPDAAEPKLLIRVHLYNAQTGQDLTVDQFLTLNVLEMAIADDFAAALPDLEKERDAAYQLAITAKRDELVAAIKIAAVPIEPLPVALDSVDAPPVAPP